MSPSASHPRRFRDEVRITAVLALPLAVAHVSSGLIGFVDNVIAGRHGTATLAGVSVGTALFWLPMMIPMGTLMALPPLVSRLDGEGRRDQIGPQFRQALWLAALLGALMFGFLCWAPTQLAWLGIAPEIRPLATDFLYGIRWGIPAFTLFLCMRYLCDGLHWTMPSMVLGFGGLLLLAPLGLLLTFGTEGLQAMATGVGAMAPMARLLLWLTPGMQVPQWGALGLGAASAVMMWVQAASFALYLVCARRFAELRLFARLDAPRLDVIGDLLRTGLPIGVTVAMEGGLFIATALVIATLGAVEAAAHQIAINVASLSFMLPFALAEATTVRVGHALGRADRAGLRRAAFAGYVLLLATQAISAGVLLNFSEAIAAIYTSDAAVAALAASLLLFAAAFQFPDGVQVLSAGALRGIKDTTVPMLLAALAYWGIGMPVGMALGLWLGYGPRGMWVGLIAGLLVASVLMAGRFLRSSQRIALGGGVESLAHSPAEPPAESRSA